MIDTILLIKYVLMSLLLVVMCGCAAATPTAPPEGVQPIEPAKTLQDFTLINTNNAPMHLSDLKGKLIVLSFGYTHCPDICPLNLTNYTLVKKKLGNDAAQVAFVFVSVDGKRDTPDVLAKHLRLFDPAFIGLSADDAIMRPFALDFYASYQLTPDANSPDGYTVTHTASWFLVDKLGKLRRVYSYGTAPDVIAADIHQFVG